MKTAIAITVDTDTLGNLEDTALASLWHAAQANQAPDYDPDAEQLVQAIGTEILKRWLQSSPPPLYGRMPGSHYWHTLQQHGSWTGPGRPWQPDAEKMAQQAAQRAQEVGAAAAGGDSQQ